MHRSGTSAIAECLANMGVAFGENLVSAAADNPRGFWEDTGVLAINNHLLQLAGAGWETVSPIDPGRFEGEAVSELRKEAGELLKNHFSKYALWGLKDPRFCRVLPFWHQVFEDIGVTVKYVFILRHPLSVGHSLMIRNGYGRERACWLWVRYVLDTYAAIKHLDVNSMDYDELLSNSKEVLGALGIELGLLRREADVDTSALKESLRHNQKSANGAENQLGIVDIALDLYRAMREAGFRDLTKNEKLHRVFAAAEEKVRELNDVARYIDALSADTDTLAERERAWLEDCIKQKDVSIAKLNSTVANLYESITELNGTVENLYESIAELNGTVTQREVTVAEQLTEIERQYAIVAELNESVTLLDETVVQREETVAKQLTEIERQYSIVGEQSAEIKHQHSIVAEQSTEIERQRADIHELKAVIAQRDAQIDLKLTEIKQLQSVVNQLNEDAEIARVSFTAAQDEIKSIQTGLGRANTELASILNSFAWRVTYPYRYVGAIAKSVPARTYKVLFAISKSQIIPSSFRSGTISRARRFKEKFFDFHNDQSNRKSLGYLARDRQRALYSCTDQVYLDLDSEDIPEIGISVVTYNSKKWVDSFFESLLVQKFPLKKINLHVVDNDSSDNTVSCLQEYFKRYEGLFASTALYQRPNLGFGQGHDFNITTLKNDFVLVTNVDIEFERDTLLRLLEDAVSDKERRVASWECRQKPYEHPKYYDPVTMETAWSSHACILLRREAYESVGGYEKRIFMYGEDVELSYRFRDAGYSTRYVPAAVVWHYTYEYENQVKPIQYFGSTLSNAYIRLRYGSYREALTIIGIYGFLLFRGGNFPGARKGLAVNALKILYNSMYFLLSRRKSDIPFPFRAWDYEMQRDGAFYEQQKLDGDLPLVSIITRTYGGRKKWLVEAMASVLNQTYPRIELIVVEDGDNSQEQLVKQIAANYGGDKIVRYVAQPKRGRSYNGNAGLALAKGRYLGFLDDDDLLFCDHVEVLVNELKNNTDIAAAYALSWEVDTDTVEDRRYGSHYKEMLHRTPDVIRQEFSADILRHHNFIPIQAILFERELYERHGGFDESMDQLEDWDLWVRYSSDARFGHVNKTTSLFRTPHDIRERARRHELLNDAYKDAVENQQQHLAQLKAS